MGISLVSPPIPPFPPLLTFLPFLPFPLGGGECARFVIGRLAFCPPPPLPQTTSCSSGRYCLTFYFATRGRPRPPHCTHGRKWGGGVNRWMEGRKDERKEGGGITEMRKKGNLDPHPPPPSFLSLPFSTYPHVFPFRLLCVPPCFFLPSVSLFLSHSPPPFLPGFSFSLFR